MVKALIFGAILASAAPGWCVDATLKRAKGDVRFLAEAETEAESVSVGAPLLFGDEIQTGPKALAHVVFSNGDAVLLKENARMTLLGTPKEVELSVSLGEFLIGLTRKLRPGQSFRVRTPAALASVRGTLFWGLSDANKDTTYASFGHSISVGAEGKTVVVEAGETVKVPFGQEPGEPEPSAIKPIYLATFALGKSLQGLNKLVKLPQTP